MSRYSHFDTLEANFAELSSNQQKALTLMIEGMNIRDIARECKIDESTFYRWQQSELFTHCLRVWRARLFDEVDKKMKTLYAKAINKLEEILDDENTEQKDLLKTIELILRFRG